jgi:hypothetical protein
MVSYRKSNIAHNGPADWCSSQAYLRAVPRHRRSFPRSICRYITHFFTVFDCAFASKIACRSVLSLISVLDDEKSVPRGDDEP